MTAHNSPLQVAAEIGIPGVIFYFILVGRIFSAAQKLRYQSESPGLSQVGTGILIGLAGYLVSGFFLSQGFSVIFYILMAISIAGGGAAANLRAKEG